MKKKKQHRRPAQEIVHRALWFHGGWGVALEPSFEHVRDPEHPEILHFEDKGGRSVSISACRIERTDGNPWRAEDMLATFPPPELTGRRYEHRTKQVASRAVWMFGDSDNGTVPSAWLLLAFVMSETTQGKGAQCTLTTPRESDLDWALDTWRSLLYVSERDAAAILAPGGSGG